MAPRTAFEKYSFFSLFVVDTFGFDTFVFDTFVFDTFVFDTFVFVTFVLSFFFVFDTYGLKLPILLFLILS